MHRHLGGVIIGVIGRPTVMLAAGIMCLSIGGRAQSLLPVEPVVDGVWQAELPVGGVWTITLERDGARVTGSISQGPEDPTEIYDGKVEGSTVAFKVRSGNGDRTIAFSGTVASGEIAFTREVQVRKGGNPGGTGIYGARAVRQFTLKRLAYAPPPVVVRQDAPLEVFRQWARQGAHAISSVDIDTRDDADLSPLRDIIGQAHVVALGEPFHGGHEPLALRNRLIRYAVTQLGFTAVALETGLTTSKRLYDHVLGKTTETEAVLRESFSYGFGNYPENLELIRWLRSFNAAQPSARQVRLYGIDLAGQVFPVAYRSVEAVLAFLDQADPSFGRTLRARYADVLQVFRSDRYGTLAPTEKDALTAKIDDLVALMRRERIRLTAATSSDDYEWALYQAVGATQDDAFLRSLPPELDLRQMGSSPEYFQQGERWDHKQEMREIAMADNVLWVQQRERARGGKVFFFSSTSHVQADLVTRGSTSRPFTLVRYRPAGMYLRSALERDMVVIGTYYGQGADPDGPRPMDPAGMDGLLSSASIPRFIMDLRELPATGTLHDWFQLAHRNRGAWAANVAPLENYDAILFFENITQTPVLMADSPSVLGQGPAPSGDRTVAIQSVRALTSNGGADPSVSPDGQRVLFSRRLDASPRGKGQLWTVPFQGGDAQRQLMTPADFPYNALTPSWSPDGRSIAFRAAPATGGGGIWLMSAAGPAHPRRLSDDAANDAYPRWLPDGRRILATRAVPGNVRESDLWVIDIDSRTARQVTSHPAYDGAPTVSPDGGHFAFPSDRLGERNIWIMPLAEGEAQVRQFTTDGGRGPAWSPDGRWIAYGCPTAPTLHALCLKAVAGGPVIQVTDGKANDFNPAWAPDGRSIVVSQTSGLAVIDVAAIVK